MNDEKTNNIKKQPEHESDCSGEEVLIYQIPAEVDSTQAPGKDSNAKKIRNKFIIFCKPIKERPRSFLAGFIILFSILLLYFLTKHDW